MLNDHDWYQQVLIRYLDSFKPDCSDELSKTSIADVMHAMIFVPRVNLDENRIADALKLRNIMVLGTRRRYDREYPEPSVLEVLVAFAVLCWEESGCTEFYPSDWMRMFLENMGILDDALDVVCDDEEYIRERLTIMMDRQYEPDGSNGGLFVITNPTVDMSRIQMFEQMDVYLGEQDPE